MWKGTQDRYANLNLWWMEYDKPKLRKFWQAEGRQRADDMRPQEHFYLTCTYIWDPGASWTCTGDGHEASILLTWDLHAVRARGLQAGGGNEIIFGDESTSIFQLAIVKRRRTKCVITSLRKSEGTILTTHRKMRNCIAAFYASAYARITTEEAMIKQVGQWVSRRLKPQANMRLAEPITLEEFKRAIDKGPRNKAREQIVLYMNFTSTSGMWLNGLSYYTQFDPTEQRSPLSASPWHDCLCAEASGTAYRERPPRTVVTLYRFEKLWSCFRVNAFNDPQWHTVHGSAR
jgi:hypothetical protein